MMDRWVYYVQHTFIEMKYIGLPLAVVGLFASLYRRNKKQGQKVRTNYENWVPRALLTAQVVYLGVFNALANIPMEQVFVRAVKRSY